MCDIRAKYLGSLDRFHELGLSGRSDRRIAHASIPIVCFSLHESYLLHREEEASDPRSRESDAIREVDTTKATILRGGERVEDEEI
jgi:hypothetical protein